MSDVSIAYRRLSNQHLITQGLKNPTEAVRWLGAVQSQDYAGAKWALAQRCRGVTDVDIDKLYDDGKILRTHVMRPTWHFVDPEDIRWLLALTAPRVKAISAYQYRKLELDEAFLERCNHLLSNALSGGKHLTRKELGEKLKKAGIIASGQRLAYIVSHAELDAVICSGARRGRQFTYALLEERAPKAKILDRDEALAELIKRYFASHGPALVADFAWWSGLTMADTRRGIEILKPHLMNETLDGKSYWFNRALPQAVSQLPRIHLLPNYDEYLISYKDYSPIFSDEVKKLDKPFGNALLAHLIVRDGKVIGGWRRELKKTEVVIKTDLLVSLNELDKTNLAAAASRYSKFLGLSYSIT